MNSVLQVHHFDSQSFTVNQGGKTKEKQKKIVVVYADANTLLSSEKMLSLVAPGWLHGQLHQATFILVVKQVEDGLLMKILKICLRPFINWQSPVFLWKWCTLSEVHNVARLEAEH